MLSRRTLATPRGEGAVSIVTVMNGTVESLAGIMNNTQPVQVSQLPKMFPERDKDNMCPLDEGRDSMSVSEAPKKKEEEPEAVRPLHAPYAAPTRAKNPEPPPPDANREDRINFNTGYDVFHVSSSLFDID